MNFLSLLRDFDVSDEAVIFKGGTIDDPAGQEQVAIENLLSDRSLGDGRIAAAVTFRESVAEQACEFLLFYEPQNQIFITAGFAALSVAVVTRV